MQNTHNKDDDEHDDIAQALAVLGKVQKLIAEGNTDLSLDDRLDKTEVIENELSIIGGLEYWNGLLE